MICQSWEKWQKSNKTLPSNCLKPTHSTNATKLNTELTKDATKPKCAYMYIKWEKKKSLRRDEAPVSATHPATTEKHQETTTQLNTPSLFNYCHIITAICLRLPHSHQSGARTHTCRRAWTRLVRKRCGRRRHCGAQHASGGGRNRKLARWHYKHICVNLYKAVLLHWSCEKTPTWPLQYQVIITMSLLLY